MGVYGVEFPMIDPWTSQPAIIDIVTELFERTAKLVETPSAEVNHTPNNSQAKAQLPDMASVLFAAYNERLEWLDRYVSCMISFDIA